jgi:hypothetical protein
VTDIIIIHPSVPDAVLILFNPLLKKINTTVINARMKLKDALVALTQTSANLKQILPPHRNIFKNKSAKAQ